MVYIHVQESVEIVSDLQAKQLMKSNNVLKYVIGHNDVLEKYIKDIEYRENLDNIYEMKLNETKYNMFNIETYSEFSYKVLKNTYLNIDIVDVKKYKQHITPTLYRIENTIIKLLEQYSKDGIDIDIFDKDTNEYVDYFVVPILELVWDYNVIIFLSTISCNEVLDDNTGLADLFVGRITKLTLINKKLVKILKRNIHNELVDARDSLQGRFKYGFDIITNRILQNHSLSEALNKDVNSIIGSFSSF
jgi:hypothetical protein